MNQIFLCTNDFKWPQIKQFEDDINQINSDKIIKIKNLKIFNYEYFCVEFDESLMYTVELTILKNIIKTTEKYKKILYFNEKMKNKICFNEKYNNLINIICILDFNFDVEYITKKFRYSKEFYFESFYRFCLCDLFKHWDDVILSLIEMISSISCDQHYYDICLFLIENAQKLTEKITIKIYNDFAEIQIKNQKYKSSNVIAEIIYLMPKIIAITHNENNQICEEICRLFGDVVIFE